MGRPVYWHGRTTEVPEPIDKMPLFIKAGLIVPMGPYLQYADEKPEDPIELRVYDGAEAEFTLYEDENDGYGYEKDLCVVIPITWNEKTQTLRIGRRKGKFPEMLRKRTFEIVRVRPGHGIRVQPTVAPNKVISYEGEEVVVCF